MDQISPVVVTGTVVHLGPHVVIVPGVPPEPTRPSMMEERRQLSIRQGLGKTTLPQRWQAGPETTIDEVHAQHTWVVVLHGEDLPADNERVQAYGELTGRSLDVRGWKPVRWSTSAWASVDLPGTDPETAESVLAGVLEPTAESWPLVSFGVSETSTGRSAVVLEVDHLSEEIQTWFLDQPAGTVKIFPFIADESAADQTTRSVDR